jgi:hypothetical protein
MKHINIFDWKKSLLLLKQAVNILTTVLQNINIKYIELFNTARERIGVYCRNHRKRVNVFCGQNVEFLNTKEGSKYCHV